MRIAHLTNKHESLLTITTHGYINPLKNNTRTRNLLVCGETLKYVVPDSKLCFLAKQQVKNRKCDKDSKD